MSKVSEAEEVVLAALNHKGLVPEGEVPRVLLFLSGGKDGIAAADITMRAVARCGFPVHVEAAHFYLVKDMMFEAAPARAFCAAHNIKLTELPDAHRISGFVRGAAYMHPQRNITAIRDVPFLEVVADALHSTNSHFGVNGYKGCDNLGRRLYVKQAAKVSGHPGVDLGNRLAMPVWRWTGTEVYAWLSYRSLPVQTPIKDVTNGGSLGFSLEPKFLVEFKRLFPQDYERCKSLFPLIDIGLMKAEMYGV